MIRRVIETFFVANLLFVAGVFTGIVLFFPWNEIKAKMEESGDVKVDDIRFAFPIGMKLSNFHIISLGATFREVTVKPSVLAFLSQRIALRVRAESGKTYLYSKISVAKGEIELRIEGKGKLEDILERSKGEFSVFVDVRGEGEGKDFKFEGGKIVLKGKELELWIPPTGGRIPIEGKLKITLADVEGEIKNSTLFVRKLRTTGDIELDLKGKVSLAIPIEFSRLDLTGRVSAPFLPFPIENIKIRGTLKNPSAVW